MESPASIPLLCSAACICGCGMTRMFTSLIVSPPMRRYVSSVTSGVMSRAASAIVFPFRSFAESARALPNANEHVTGRVRPTYERTAAASSILTVNGTRSETRSSDLHSSKTPRPLRRPSPILDRSRTV